MKRTLVSGPWYLWIVLFAVVLALGMAAVPPAALAQGDDDVGIGDDEGIDVGDDEGIDIGDDEGIDTGDDDVDVGGDDDTGDVIEGETGDDDTEGGEEVSALDEGEGAGPKESDVRAEGRRTSFWDMCVMGGPLMFVLLGIQIVVLTLVLESCFNVNTLKVLPVDLVESIEDDFEKNDVDAVVTKCEENPGMLANVLHAGLTAPSPAETDVKEAIELAGEHEGESFMSHVGYLSIHGVIAPMVGLLGTVTGMILAFTKVAYEAAIGKPQLLAEGIYQALLTTMFGLIIGIPAMFMYYYFKNRGIKILMLVENSVKRFMKWRSQPDNTGVPRGGLVPKRLSLLIDEALSNAFVGIMPVIGFILGPFAIAKAVKIKAELREVGGGNPGSALAIEPWKATMAFALGIVDIVIWPILTVVGVMLGAI